MLDKIINECVSKQFKSKQSKLQKCIEEITSELGLPSSMAKEVMDCLVKNQLSNDVKEVMCKNAVEKILATKKK